MRDSSFLTEIEREELDRRLAEYRQDQNPGEPWRAVLREIEELSFLPERRDGLQATGSMGGEEGGDEGGGG